MGRRYYDSMGSDSPVSRPQIELVVRAIELAVDEQFRFFGIVVAWGCRDHSSFIAVRRVYRVFEPKAAKPQDRYGARRYVATDAGSLYAVE